MKSKEWFYKRCLQEVKRHGRFGHLCWDILEKGVGQKDRARGHVTQAIGVSQAFLAAHPNLVATIQAADPTRPFDVPHNQGVRDALIAWLADCEGVFSRRYGYSYDTFKRIMTPTLGGTCRGGGGGDDEFKRVLRLMAEFLS